MSASRRGEIRRDAWSSRRGGWLWILTVFVVFATVRALYWCSIHEQPFSDMADYHSIAQQVWKTFSFEHNSFWKSYKPPGMPFLAAGIVGPFPGDVGLWIWRIVLALITFMSALSLSIQLTHLCGSGLAGLSFLFVVALSKSSIFWSYRFSTESLTEAMTYVVIALYLWFTRDIKGRTALHAALLGAASITLVLIRPNMMPLLAIVPVGIALRWIAIKGRPQSMMLVHLIAFVAGVMILWTPWLYRGVRLYGEVVPFSTQGPYSFLWEVGGFYYDDPELGTRNVNADILQVEAPSRFKTDKEAANLASLAGKQWLRQLGYGKFVTLVFKRLGVMIHEREMSLSTTPRAALFTSSVDSFLLDKSLGVVCLAVMGLLTGTLVFGLEFAFLGAMMVAPILLSACFMGEPRMLEPMLPLILFAALVGLYLSAEYFRKLLRRVNIISRSA